MPEFRFRRKKNQQQKQQRHTVQDHEEEQAPVVTAMKPVAREETTNSTAHPSSSNEHSPSPLPEPAPIAATGGSHTVSTGTLAREREKFFDLLRSKYPEQSRGIEELMANGKRESTERNGHERSLSTDEELLALTKDDEEEEDEEEEEEDEEEGSPFPPRMKPLSTPARPRYSGCFFLRQGTELRRCPIPSPITISTLKNLFVNTFDLRPSLLDDPQCQVMFQDRLTQKWKPLTDIGEVYDNCVLQLVDPLTPAADQTLPISGSQPTLNDMAESTGLGFAAGSCDHLRGKGDTDKSFNGLWRSDKIGHNLQDLSTLPDALSLHHSHHTPQHSSVTSTGAQFGSPYSVASSTSGVGSESLQCPVSPQRLVRQARLIQKSVQELKEDYVTCRKEQLAEIADFSLTLRNTTFKITAAIRGCGRMTEMDMSESVDQCRRERIELYADKEAYGRASNETMLEMSILETAVDDIRRDVVDRRCRVLEKEVDRLINVVESTNKALKYAKEQYRPLEAKMKKVMEEELRTIVEEEQFIQDECPRLRDAQDKCHKLLTTLGTMKQLASLQSHRTPLVPIFHPVANPDRQALLENIKAVTPNHMHRMESLEMAECVQRKKKELMREKEDIKQFETLLRVQKDHLHKMGYATQVQDKQEKKMRALYMEEKARREKEVAKEMEWERKVADKKREEERQRLKERLALKKQQKEEKRRLEQRKEKEGAQDSQSSAGSERNNLDQAADSFCEDTEEEADSLQFSSSISSTTSLLEHIRSLGGWMTDGQQDKPRTGSHAQDMQDNSQYPTREDTTPQAGASDRVTPLVNGSSQHSGTHKHSPKEEQRHHINGRVSPLQGHVAQSHSQLESQVAENMHQSLRHLQAPTKDKQSPAQEKRYPSQGGPSLTKENLSLQQEKRHVGQHEVPPSKEKRSPLQEKRHINQYEPAWGKLDFAKFTQVGLPRERGQGVQPGLQVPKTALKSSKPSPPQEKARNYKAKQMDRGTKTMPAHTQLGIQGKQQPVHVGHRAVKQSLSQERTQHVAGRAPPTKSAPHPLSDVMQHQAVQRTGKPVYTQQIPSTRQQPGRVQLSRDPAHLLSDAPPRLRKSIGYPGEFDDNAGFYDVLEAREGTALSQPQPSSHLFGAPPAANANWWSAAPPKMQKQNPQHPSHPDMSDVGTKPAAPRQYNRQYSNSQPDSFALSSNPAYDTAMVGILPERRRRVESQGAKKTPTVPKRQQAIRKSMDDTVLAQYQGDSQMQMRRVHPESRIPQQPSSHLQHNSHLPHSKGDSQLSSHQPGSHQPGSHQPSSHQPSSHQPGSHQPGSRPKSGGTLTQYPHVQPSSKPKVQSSTHQQPQQPQLHPKAQSGLSSSKHVGESGSECSSDNHSRVQSAVSGTSAQQQTASGNHSISSGFSSGHSGTGARQSHVQVAQHSRSTHIPSQPAGPQSSHGHTSGLLAPRTRYQPQSQTTQSHGHGVPTQTTHHKTSHLAVHHVHDEGALTSYPRFQRRPPPPARPRDTRTHGTRAYPGHPGTGHTSQQHKPQEHSKSSHSRSPDVGSLV